jgi:uncharacterized protein with GYD domain
VEVYSAYALILSQSFSFQQKNPKRIIAYWRLPYQTGGFVPIYILLSTLTSEGRKTIKERPERIKEVDKEIEAFGAKVLQQYSVLGRYDFVNIVEAPNNEAIMQVSIELGARGTVQITSMPATPIDDFLTMIKK